MTVEIVLSAAQAAKVRGLTRTTSENGKPDRHLIEPIALVGDLQLIVPPEVLADPIHAAKLAEWKADSRVLVDLRDASLRRDVLPTEIKQPPFATAQTGEIGATKT